MTALTADLEHAELLLLAIGRLSMDRFAAIDPALRHQLNTGLRTALLAVSAAQSPARQGHTAAAVDLVSTPGGPVRTSELVLGRGPMPGPGAAGSAVARSAGAVVAASAGDNSGRDGKDTAALVNPAAVASRPVSSRPRPDATRPGPVAARPRAAAHAGGPPALGVSDFCLPKAPGTQALMASLARRAD